VVNFADSVFENRIVTQLLMKLIIFYRAQKCIAVVARTFHHLVLSWTRWRRVHNINTYFLSITRTSNITLSLISILIRKYLSLDSVTYILYAFVISHIPETDCFLHHVRALSEEKTYKLRSYLLGISLQASVTSILFWNTAMRCLSRS
jgi:hypothetical protein